MAGQTGGKTLKSLIPVCIGFRVKGSADYEIV